MKKYITIRNAIYTLLIILVGIQFIQIDKDNPPVDQNVDFAVIANPPDGVLNTLMAACYDCHSHETVYPWYSNIAPFSWIIGNHIHVGRDELNFSVWGTYETRRQDHKLEEIIELVEEGEMPLKGYIPLHPDADLSEEQTEALFAWIRQYREKLGG